MRILETSNRTILGKVLRAPLRLVPRGIDLPIASGPLKGMRWRVGSSTHGCWLGSYEQRKAERMVEACKPGMVAYDIGANAGYYSLLMSRCVGGGGHVYAFEPFPENVSNLLHHLSVNDVTNCTVIESAVSDRSGLAGFAAGASNSMGALTRAESSLRVPTVAIDDLVERQGLPTPDVVKMDAEGAESAVLAGAERTLALGRAQWFIAVHGTDQAARCVGILRKAGYRVYLLDGALLESSKEIREVDEIYAER